MEQQQFKISFSLGTKLILSAVMLLTTVILFLNISAILLLKEDKQAYIYQSQSNEAVLAGREFVTNAKHAIDTLRLALSNVDPLRQVTPQQASAIQSVLNNQSNIFYISIHMVRKELNETHKITHAAKEGVFSELGVSIQDFDLQPETIRPILPDLLRESYGLTNFTKLNGSPALGIVVADLKFQEHPAGLPVAIGVISLKELASELHGMNLTIASRSGWILFDTDPTALYSRANISNDALFKQAAASSLSTGANEFEDRSTRYLGSFAHPGLGLVVLAKMEWDKAMKATYALTEKFLLLGLMAIGVAVIFTILFSKTLTAPINRLYRATLEVAQGNFNVDLTAKSKDEIGALTHSFTLMSKQITGLIQEKMEKVQLENEVAIASAVQQTLIPPPSFRNDKILIRSHYQSATQCGGDWWGFFGVGDKLCLMIADATGHGLPSALITASARSSVSVLHKLAQEDPDFSFSPGAMLSYANRVVYDASLGKIMMTFFASVIDFSTGMITYANAGHNPPWLFKKEGEKFSLKSMVAVGQRLGESRDVSDFEERAMPIGEEDILFLYTDGLLEGKNKAGDMYGKKKTRKIVESSLAAGPERLIQTVMTDFLKHNDGKPLDDDVTIAVAQILSLPKASKLTYA